MYNRLVVGTLILTIANLLTKFMGFFYRVFMSNTIGAEGMGLYQLVFPLYLLAWSITSAGLTTSISHLTAKENIHGQTGNIHKLVKQAISLALGLSFVVAFIFFFYAEEIALLVLKEERTILSLQLLAFAVPFMAIGSCIRGYFLGLQNTWIPALSQVLEQVIRIAVVYCFMTFFLPMGLTYACALAVLGVILGEMTSCVFAIVAYQYTKRKKYMTTPNKRTIAIYKTIVAMALPLSATRIASSLLSTIENILIPRQLALFGQNTTEALSQYGELTGMILPLIFLPSACLMAASISLVPELSEASAVQHTTRIQKTVSVTFLFTFIIGIGSAALFAVYPKEICYLVYSRQDLGNLLLPFAFLCPFYMVRLHHRAYSMVWVSKPSCFATICFCPF
ncbi:polysaccharide biosynthesis protein [Chakrabartyella piscis]|uniref:putative polysaccharide biosynthesis protein n=1 Tax=Chakrabartyella piscis TaxID=2918914 RepID=UPI002958D3C9|nr:polysaccharide biosynthesis protein [Chakrabartyella piscis]